MVLRYALSKNEQYTNILKIIHSVTILAKFQLLLKLNHEEKHTEYAYLMWPQQNVIVTSYCYILSYFQTVIPI